MSKNAKYSKDDFLRLFVANLDAVSSDKESSREFLLSEGLDPEVLFSDALKRIKRLQLQIHAKDTENEMSALKRLRERVISSVEKLMNSPGFSFPEFVKSEGLALQNRNIESFSEEDVRNTLIQYLTLKILDSEDTETDGH